MPLLTPSFKNTADSSGSISNDVLNGALNHLLSPLARLCLANGVNFAIVEEVLKRVFVQEAQGLIPGAPSQRAVSRISTTTGIGRREVTRLTKSESPARTTKPPLANQVFARWTADPAMRDDSGTPCTLKRQGPAPSFEALAQSITRDIHPRSLLDELIRLGLARYDEETDCVNLVRSEFVPKRDSRQILDFLANNVGDHFAAAVANIVEDDRRHLEQAVFADELSTESIEALRPLIAAQWQALRDTLVPALSALIEADSLAGRLQNKRVRIGLYTFSEATSDNPPPAGKSTPSRKRNHPKGVLK